MTAHLDRSSFYGAINLKDVTPLANLTKLRELGLAYNAVESVEPLAEFHSVAKIKPY